MMTCAITTSFLGSLATLFLFLRYAAFADFNLSIKAGWFIFALAVGCIPLYVGYSFESIFGRFYPFYRYSLYFIFIGAVLFLTLTLVRDAAWLIACKTGWIGIMSRHQIAIINFATFGISLIMTFWALFSGVKVPNIKSIELSSPKIVQESTIAILSDLHIHRVINPQKIKSIVDKTNAQNPDIILLAGDIIDDDVAKVTDITEILKGLKAKHGVYFVTGNHEFYAGYKETVEVLQKLGFVLLENSGVNLQDLYLAGIPDTFAGHSYGKEADIKRTLANADQNAFRLIMSHTPTEFAPDITFDLEVSGHTHGGQIFPFHIFTKLHNKYLSGFYDMENNKAKIYVTNGAGQWGPQMRFLAPSEITILKLTPQAN